MSKSIRGAILPIVAGVVGLAAAAILVIVFMVHPETKVASPSQAMQPRGEDRQAGDLSPPAILTRTALALPPKRLLLLLQSVALWWRRPRATKQPQPQPECQRCRCRTRPWRTRCAVACVIRGHRMESAYRSS